MAKSTMLGMLLRSVLLGGSVGVSGLELKSFCCGHQVKQNRPKGISSEELLAEGVASFAASFEKLMTCIAFRREAVLEGDPRIEFYRAGTSELTATLHGAWQKWIKLDPQKDAKGR